MKSENTLKRLLLLLSFALFFSPVFAGDSEKISFTKKEIAFFKWNYFKKDGKKCDIFIPKVLHIDGDDNLYFLYWNDLVYVVSADGKTVKKIDWGNNGGLEIVGENGNLYSQIIGKKGEGVGFILTKPDGSKIEYKNIPLSSVKNGIAYDSSKQESITITDEVDKPERLPAQLHWEAKHRNKFTIYTDKLNSHLKNIKRHVNPEKIQIEIEKKDGLRGDYTLIGVDDNGDTYFFCFYLPLEVRDGPWVEADVMVYSIGGQKIAEIPLELDYFSKQTFDKDVLINIHGDVFQMWVSQDGVHISKWAKN